MKITYWICSYKSEGNGKSKYTPIIQVPNRDVAEKINPRKYTILPQVEY